MSAVIPPRREFKKWMKYLNGQVHDLEHFRAYKVGEDGVKRPVGNYAVLVTRDGMGHVGHSMVSGKDQYNSKRGFAIAVGRAMKAAVKPNGEIPLPVWAPERGDKMLFGVELRDRCRDLLVKDIGKLVPSGYGSLCRYGQD